eukprot:m.348661 g.348661  ORF g.348661 m.348661 type:complete len:54 (-) comp38379_c0_seq1:190-351(-)
MCHESPREAVSFLKASTKNDSKKFVDTCKQFQGFLGQAGNHRYMIEEGCSTFA